MIFQAPTYDDQFPTLGGGPGAPRATSARPFGEWANKPRVQSSTITQVICIWDLVLGFGPPNQGSRVPPSPRCAILSVFGPEFEFNWHLHHFTMTLNANPIMELHKISVNPVQLQLTMFYVCTLYTVHRALRGQFEPALPMKLSSSCTFDLKS